MASTLVQTEYGWVQGQTDGRVNAWLGIHYAGTTAGGSLSPRGDWRAPSDGNARAWIAELEANVPEG